MEAAIFWGAVALIGVSELYRLWKADRAQRATMTPEEIEAEKAWLQTW